MFSCTNRITKGVDPLLKIKKAHKGFVLYDTCDFRRHTHTDSYMIAKIIKSNVEHNRLPKSKSIRLIYSHYRVAKKKSYKVMLLELIETIIIQHLHM